MKQKHFLISLAVLATGISVGAQTKDNVKTTFQTSREWKPSIDNRADAVMVYGVGGNPSDKSRKLSFEERVKSWKERGNIIHFMTGGSSHRLHGTILQIGSLEHTLTFATVKEIRLARSSGPYLSDVTVYTRK